MPNETFGTANLHIILPMPPDFDTARALELYRRQGLIMIHKGQPTIQRVWTPYDDDEIAQLGHS